MTLFKRGDNVNWEHKCSLRWLRERQKYLTASDIKSLVPVTKTGRPRKVDDEAYYRVLSSKLTKITDEDCWSFGAAARGHILEPYAIDALNVMLLQMSKQPIYWWDDKVVHDGNRSLAFSPDGMDVPQDSVPTLATTIAEVKCYSTERHMIVAHTPKNLIEERWQIATAMAVLNNIEHAYLMLYDPRLITHKAVMIEWERGELEDEIGMILDVEKRWDMFRMSHHSPYAINGGVWQAVGPNEQAIIDKLRKKGVINPTT